MTKRAHIEHIFGHLSPASSVTTQQHCEYTTWDYYTMARIITYAHGTERDRERKEIRYVLALPTSWTARTPFLNRATAAKTHKHSVRKGSGFFSCDGNVWWASRGEDHTPRGGEMRASHLPPSTFEIGKEKRKQNKKPNKNWALKWKNYIKLLQK